MQRSALSQGLTPCAQPKTTAHSSTQHPSGALHPQGPLARGKDGKEGLPESCDTRPCWARTRHLATESTLPGTQTRLRAGRSDLKQPSAEAERCRLHAMLGKVLTLGVGPSATSEGPLMKADHQSWLTTRSSRWEETRQAPWALQATLVSLFRWGWAVPGVCCISLHPCDNISQ